MRNYVDSVYVLSHLPAGRLYLCGMILI